MAQPVILVTGQSGQLAQSLAERGRAAGVAFTFAARPELDLEAPQTIRRVIERLRPAVIINAAAYTAVDAAEDDEARAVAINATAPGLLAEAAVQVGARLIHFSTDYVFDGRKEAAYVETDAIAPQSVYGRSKAAGEAAIRETCPDHVILRTAWVYSPFGRNFVRTMLTLAKSRDTLAVVEDQHGNPTSALDLADAVLSMLECWRGGGREGLGETFHLAGDTEADWCSFARQIFRISARHGGPSAVVTGIASDQYPTRARRPMNSRLDSGRFAGAFGYRMPPLEHALEEVVARILAEG